MLCVFQNIRKATFVPLRYRVCKYSPLCCHDCAVGRSVRMCVLHVSTSKPIPHARSCFVRIHTNNTSLQSRIKMNTNVFVYENELFLSDGKLV